MGPAPLLPLLPLLCFSLHSKPGLFRVCGASASGMGGGRWGHARAQHWNICETRKSFISCYSWNFFEITFRTFFWPWAPRHVAPWHAVLKDSLVLQVQKLCSVCLPSGRSTTHAGAGARKQRASWGFPGALSPSGVTSKLPVLTLSKRPLFQELECLRRLWTPVEVLNSKFGDFLILFDWSSKPFFKWNWNSSVYYLSL